MECFDVEMSSMLMTLMILMTFSSKYSRFSLEIQGIVCKLKNANRKQYCCIEKDKKTLRNITFLVAHFVQL